MLSDDVQVFDHVPYRIDGRPLSPNISMVDDDPV
jgi:hypothetical protein